MYLQGMEGEVQVIVRKPVKSRSLNQNNYLWGCVYALISEATGFTPDEAHELCRLKFHSTWKSVGDRQYRIPVSTTTMSTVEFETYCSNIRQWSSAELNIYIPLPNEYEH